MDTSTIGLNSFTEKSLTFFQKHISPGLRPAENLQDGILGREEYEKLKQDFVQEGLATADDPELEQKFNSFLVDALDGKLDQQSVPGLLEAIEQLASHPDEANAVQFAKPNAFASKADIPKLGRLMTHTPAGRKEPYFQSTVQFNTESNKERIGSDAGKTLGSALSAQLEPYRTQLREAGLLHETLKDNIDVSTVFQKMEPADQKLFLSCLSSGKYQQAYSVLSVNNVKQSGSTSPGLNGYMNPLPNLSYGGPVTIEVNNPEQVHGACKVFSSSQVKPPIELGVGENKSFNYYSYCDVRQMKPRTGPAFQATVVNNPGPETVRIKVRGSGLCNHEASLEARAKQVQAAIDKLKLTATDQGSKAKLDALIKLDILGPDGKIRPDKIKGSDGVSRVTGDLTRNADYLLTLEQILGVDMLSDNAPEGQDYIEIPAGESMAVYTKIPQGSNTMRAAYQFEVISPEGGQKLDVDVVVTENTSVGKPPKPLFPDSGLSTCGMLAPSKDIRAALVEKLPMINAGNELMKGDDYEALLLTGKATLRGLKDEDHDGKITTSDMKLHNLKKNQEIHSKNKPLSQSEKAEAQGQLFKLGRINGIKEGSEIRSTIPPIDVSKSDVSLTYAINTKVIERAGTDQDQSMKMLGISQFPNGPANLDDIAHGNYNAEYVISTQLVNNGDSDQKLYISIGSPDAGGMFDNGEPQKPSYDPSKTDNPSTRSRFTGVAEIQIAGRSQPILAKIVNGHVELPQEIEGLTIKKQESLYITVRLMIPTNSTGPQTIQLSSQAPDAK
jgi:hypothetical protein